MNPDIFLTQEEIPLLVQALNTFVLDTTIAEERQNMLINAGIHLSFRSKMNSSVSSLVFATKLVASFREYRVSIYQPGYHPMISLLEYLLQTYEWEDQDRNLFRRLIKRGQDNFKGLAARSTVGRIESPPGTAAGTGVMVGKQLLLTSHHVFKRIFEQGQERVWVRFGYKTGRYGVEIGELFELDIKNIVRSILPTDHPLDYELVKIIDGPNLQSATLSHHIPCPTQPVRLIHHPRGEAIQISEPGEILLVDTEFIQHNIQTDYGSSGAPIFDLDWRIVALHRGTLCLSRPTPAGITEGVPISSIWKAIEPQIRLSTT
ncbi:MAG TPA: trypsin-like peptidase domain-containing protein [Ktedonobacteraceae bacterium]|nr:trypsin-like peptidase domain-containing protein [Ktedonobacteraceae bacterium]